MLKDIIFLALGVVFVSCANFLSDPTPTVNNNDNPFEIYDNDNSSIINEEVASEESIKSSLRATTTLPTKYTLEEVFTGPTDTWSLDSLYPSKDGLFITTSNYSKGTGDRSKIFILNSQNPNGILIHTGSEETISPPAIVDDIAYFPTEWGSHVLVGNNGSISNGMSQPGRWSICGATFKGKPLIPYNNSLTSSGYMDDYPAIYDVKAQKLWGRVKIKSMPNAMYVFNNALWIAIGNKEKNRYVISTSGGKYSNPGCISLGKFGGYLFCGTENGSLYRLRDGAFRKVFQAQTKQLKGMSNVSGRLWFTGPNPDKLYLIHTDGKIYTIAGFNDGTSEACCATDVTAYNGSIYWGRSDGSKAHVYKLKAQ